MRRLGLLITVVAVFVAIAVLSQVAKAIAAADPGIRGGDATVFVIGAVIVFVPTVIGYLLWSLLPVRATVRRELRAGRSAWSARRTDDVEALLHELGAPKRALSFRYAVTADADGMRLLTARGREVTAVPWTRIEHLGLTTAMYSDAVPVLELTVSVEHDWHDATLLISGAGLAGAGSATAAELAHVVDSLEQIRDRALRGRTR